MRLIGGETHPTLPVVESSFISVNERSVRFHGKSLYDVEMGVRCAMSATRLIGTTPHFHTDFIKHIHSYNRYLNIS